MPKYYSLDLRGSVLKCLNKNPDKKAASDIFGVGIAIIFCWAKRKKEKGNVVPLRGKYAYKRIHDQ